VIARLVGTLVHKDEDSAIVDVAGVGYQLSLSADELATLALGDDCTLWVHTHVREDAILLFGFVDPLRRTLFARLINLHGVGPKLALAILGTFEPSKLRDIAVRHDAKALKSIAGVGPKGAQRLALELEPIFAGLSLPQSSSSKPKSPQAVSAPGAIEVRSALVNLGYPDAVAQEAIEEAEREAATQLDFDQLLRRALAMLRKR
jgi:Holliday junction DNA helicase RuvA